MLILDDDPDLREVLGELIHRRLGCETLEFGSVEEMQLAESSALETGVALLDVDLGPRRPSGLEALAWLRAHGYQGRIYFLTAHAKNHPLVMEALRFENVSVKSKPVPHRELLRDVGSAFAIFS